MEMAKKMKIAIAVLAVLLAVSLLSLSGVFLVRYFSGKGGATVTVPDNEIGPGAGSGMSGGLLFLASYDDAAPGADAPEKTGAPAGEEAATIRLYRRQSLDNTPFALGNMLPGDRETKGFCVQVSHRGEVTVHFRAAVKPGYEKLAEVLTVTLRSFPANGGEDGLVLYEGLMRDMPEVAAAKLAGSAEDATDELYFEITVGLDTGVGNEYQGQKLSANFSWWVEETGNLTPSPEEKGGSDIVTWASFSTATGSVMVLVSVVAKYKEGIKKWLKSRRSKG